MPPSQPVESISSPAGRYEKKGFYSLLITAIIAPLAFWPSPYVGLDVAKTAVIAVGTLTSAVFFALEALKDRRLVLPPRSIAWTSVLIIVSLVVSSISGIQTAKSFFGQSFELGTASFLSVLFLAGLVAFISVYKRKERAIILFVGTTASFLVLFILQTLLVLSHGRFPSLGILNSVTSTILGSWYLFAAFAAVICLIALVAISVLSPSKWMKAVYWFLAIISFVILFLVNSVRVWEALLPVFFGITIYLSSLRPRPSGVMIISAVKRLAWIPAICFIVAAVMVWRGPIIMNGTITKLGLSYNELSLPWQMTLDVTAGAIKDRPLFGYGPSHFSQAFLAYKPTGINTTDYWGAEFSTGSGLIPTFLVTEGAVGGILWILFLVFFGIAGARLLRRIENDPHGLFIALSSYSAAAMLWILSFIYVPDHVLLFITFILTGVSLAVGSSAGALRAFIIEPKAEGVSRKIWPSFMIFAIVVALVWGVIYVKKIVAMGYFASGVKQLSEKNNPTAADSYFAKAVSIDPSDIYWQARAEAGIAMVNNLAANINSGTSASDTQAAATRAVSIFNGSLQYATNAIAFDQGNYYNYLSAARVSQAAAAIGINGASTTAIRAFQRAIAINPQNPSLYLNLAQFLASQNDYNDAITVLGSALRVKSNYLDAVFLLTQVEAAKGNLPDAITAAQFAIQLNPSNALLYFQLGVLEYYAANYSVATQALSVAVKIQSNYANAQYFLGLSEARLGDTARAIAQFEALAASNPDNQEVSAILTALRSGSSIFGNPAPIAPAPAKRKSLPIKDSAAK